jgi:LysR family hydrogen peroxide-inducible transcriptional activator
MPAGHALQRVEKITLDRLGTEPFVLLSEIHCLGGQTLAFCQQPDFHPPVRCKTAQLTTVLQLVALGHGVSIVPAMALASGVPEGVLQSSIAPEPPRRTLCLVWRKERYQGRAVRALVTALREEGARRASPARS